MDGTSNTDPTGIDVRAHGADILAALEAVEGIIGGYSIEPELHHLVLLRASQINKCAYCVKMHTRDARINGETDKRLDHLIVWRQVDDFTPREKAAFAWTEALTELDAKTDLAPLRGALKQHFTEREISALTAIVAMINLWNRIGISQH